MNNLLVVEDLRVTYGGVTAVDGVSLTVAGIALALTAIKNLDGVARELASATREPGRWLGAVRDRVVPVRWAPGPGASAPPAGAPDPAPVHPTEAGRS